jgi:uridine kinase
MSSEIKGKCIVVGIAGGTASGKSTLTTALVEAITASVHTVEAINVDRYFRRSDPAAPQITLSTGQTLFNANHPESADIATLVADLDARIAAAAAPDVIIVEGLMVLHAPSIRERLDLKVFVELDADLRAVRRLLRDMSGVRGNADPQFIATYYRECARVGHGLYVEPSRVHADLIVRGDAEAGRIAPMLVAAINAARDGVRPAQAR